jgi:dihydrofolate synthase/folylpolyglutamate synthase
MARSTSSRTAVSKRTKVSATATPKARPGKKVAAAKSAPARRPESGTSIRNYKSALAFLDSVPNYERQLRPVYNESRFSLARMQKLLALVDNPHKALKVLHVAGTKGKGSTCHMLASMLQQTGKKIGLYTSPHFVDLRERISINGDLITEAAFTRTVDRLAAAGAKLGADTPSFFEYLTAAAFLHFADQKVEYAVLETGLGGRLDATNVCTPLVTGITNISFDHMAQLGNKLELIAEEKGGIFKPNVPAISAPQPPAVKKALKKVAQKNGTDVKFIGSDIEFSYRFESSRTSGPHTRICMATSASRFDHLQVPLMGEHQAFNCGVALAMFDALRERGHAVTEQHAIDGLSKVEIEGRLEIIRQTPPRVILDVAHNAASIRALMRAIGQNITYDSMVVIFGCAADKDIDGMLTQLQIGADKVIFTPIPNVRSADAKELLTRFVEKSGKMAQLAGSLEEAYQIAQHCVTRDDIICITGSFYLVGQAKKLHAAGKFA